MPSIQRLSRLVSPARNAKNINWHPGHMYAGTKAIQGKLKTVDCVIEVHDARIPFIGRNEEFRKHLGAIKPRLLVLNKADLADLSRWNEIQSRLRREGDQNVMLTELKGSNMTKASRSLHNMLDTAVRLINNSDRFNRSMMNFYRIMVVGIPNVGKSTLINRLRQQYLGRGGEPAKTGPEAGVTKHVENMIKVCPRPPIYLLDTPGILQPGATRDVNQAMRLALCSTINDKAVDFEALVNYLLEYLNKSGNHMYKHVLELDQDQPVNSLDDLVANLRLRGDSIQQLDGLKNKGLDRDSICLEFIKSFRVGKFGNVTFD